MKFLLTITLLLTGCSEYNQAVYERAKVAIRRENHFKEQCEELTKCLKGKVHFSTNEDIFSCTIFSKQIDKFEPRFGLNYEENNNAIWQDIIICKIKGKL